MGLALVCVGVAALCSGTAIVLQAVAARRLPADVRLDAALVGGLARSPLYLLALGLVALGFGLSFVALRTLPVFAVQAGRASSLAVAAVLSVVVLGARLRWTDWLGLGSIAVGLVVLAMAVAPQTTITPAAGTAGSSRPRPSPSRRSPPPSRSVRPRPGAAWSWPPWPARRSACSRSARTRSTSPTPSRC